VRILQSFRFGLTGVPGIAVAATLAGALAAEPLTALALQEPTPGTAAPQQAAKLSADQLESLVAPIALYPDPLLAQMLIASTYPLDVIAAQQWLDKNKGLSGDALEKAVEKQSWDPSVQGLVSIPDALKRLSENIQWTSDLGDAFLAQQGDVMDAVQDLRKKAKEGGKLESTEQQKVEVKVVETKQVIEIQPTSPEVVYVPSYSPSVIWGPPLYYPYPPIYYPPYYGGAWLGFGVGIAVGIGIAGGWCCGCGWGGGGNNININNNNNYVNHRNNQNGVNRSGNSNWSHNAQQRGGAPYKDRATANKYGGGARGDSAQSRRSQAQTRQASNRSSGNFDRSRSGAGAGAGGGAGNFDRSRGGSGSSSRVGSRDVAPSNRGSSAFGGSQSGDRARSSSSRGSSSMSSSRGGGGMSRGGGGMSRGGGGGGGRRR
jgi:hypothetical protein